MRGRDQTSMGGVRETFLTTHWSLIEDIRAGQDKDQALISILLERYWKPVYCYLRRKGYGNEQAKDLTQSFFHEIVLSRNFIVRVEKAEGRFRSYLLHALNQFLIDKKRIQAAQKRIPKDKIVSLDIVEPPELPQTVTKLGPEDCFNYAWKTALLDRTLSEVQAGYLEQGMETYWYVFRDRIVQPILQSTELPSLKEICAKYSIEDEAKASNMIVTVKRRFQTVLKKNLRSTVISEGDLMEEFKEIFIFFSKKAQDS
jgi:DNA-directed RNA polymerase specialized sigma24 family protein